MPDGRLASSGSKIINIWQCDKGTVICRLDTRLASDAPGGLLALGAVVTALAPLPGGLLAAGCGGSGKLKKETLPLDVDETHVTTPSGSRQVIDAQTTQLEAWRLQGVGFDDNSIKVI
jgi:hypothetical protein